MTQNAKILIDVLKGVSDANIAFSDLISLLYYLGFEERIRGSHHIFCSDDVEEILNIQPCGSKAKPYQEALANIELIIQEWIETAKELGRDIPDQKEDWYTHNSN